MEKRPLSVKYSKSRLQMFHEIFISTHLLGLKDTHDGETFNLKIMFMYEKTPRVTFNHSLFLVVFLLMKEDPGA